jgi:hypothetical protein
MSPWCLSGFLTNLKRRAAQQVPKLICMTGDRVPRGWAITALMVGSFAMSLAMAETNIGFDQDASLPANWHTGVTGRGTSKWEVIEDRTAPSGRRVLRQSGEATFCWAAKVDEKIRNGFAEVKLKPIAGKEDQAGGLIWRFQDASNYYLVRANALEDNVVLYKTVDGKRSSLQVKGRMFGYGVDADVPQGKWSTLRVEFDGNLFTVFFQGQKLFQVEDATFREAGAVGLWTKADSVTLFDDFIFGGR